ncbi:unnamed protein product [Menidia menidia]|uniref:(Atlantic silverside) hypothetical protein n=1 Tax=Menidia menidia TaxID=238744 RepID=A0A8S4AEB5_9TELE|nr:unnamed protein product [Menidia menidia]
MRQPVFWNSFRVLTLNTPETENVADADDAFSCTDCRSLEDSLQLSIKEIKERWSALFDVPQINTEFHRTVTVNLEAKFMFMLDHYTPKLLGIFQAKKGAAGQRHRAEMNIRLQ